MRDQTGSGGANQLPRNESIPPDLYEVRITSTRETIDKLMREFELDVGCRPHPEANPDGTGTILVYASEERIRQLKAAGYDVKQGQNVSALGRERQAEVGKRDRFEGGRVVPRGLGEKRGRGKERKELS